MRNAVSELVGEDAEDGLDGFGIGRVDLTADIAVAEPVLQVWRAPREDPPGEGPADDILDPSRRLSTVLSGATEGVFFEPTLRWDILPDGAIAYADSSAYVVKVVTPGGAVTEVLRRPIPPEVVTDRLRSEAVEQEIRRLTPVFERADPSGGSQDGGDVAVGPGAEDGEGVSEGGERDAALEQDAEPPDQIVGPFGQVGEGALLDLAVLAEGLAEQDGGWGVPVGHAFDVHGYDRNDYTVCCQVDSVFITWVHIPV